MNGMLDCKTWPLAVAILLMGDPNSCSQASKSRYL